MNCAPPTTGNVSGHDPDVVATVDEERHEPPSRRSRAARDEYACHTR